MKILFLYMYVKYVLNVFIGDLFNTLKVNSYPKICLMLHMFYYLMGNCIFGKLAIKMCQR